MSWESWVYMEHMLPLEWDQCWCDYPSELVIQQITWEPAEFLARGHDKQAVFK